MEHTHIVLRKKPLALRFDSRRVLTDDELVKIERARQIRELTKDFNPEVHVIVTKEQLNIAKKLEALANLSPVVNEVAKQVNELHAVQTGNIFQGP